MNTFNKKSLYAALAGVGALGATGAAQAVNVNPDGLGQALIYPYYTTRSVGGGDAYNSLLTVVNSTASAKAVKVRFLEGRNSLEVLDFNLFLSAFDVWTTAIVPSGEGAGIQTSDTSCTVPKITGTVGFVNYLLSDGAGDSLDRTKEGYVEIIEMGNILDGTAAWSTVTHSKGTNNVPNCSASILENFTTMSSTSTTVTGNGGLFGGVTLINTLQGSDYSVDATALESFFNGPGNLYRDPGSPLPNLNNSESRSLVYYRGVAVTSNWIAGIDAVSAILMHNTLMNTIVLDTATLSKTDWVITMPTKQSYVNNVLVAIPPFQRVFTSTGACDDIGINIWDREERTGTSPVNFSPPQGQTNTSLCWEANVLTWKGSNLLGSTNSRNVDPTQTVSSFQNGWARVDFSNARTGPVAAHAMVSLEGLTYAGLPVIGFAAESYNNNAKTNSLGQPVQSAYGGNFNHKLTRNLPNFTAP